MISPTYNDLPDELKEAADKAWIRVRDTDGLLTDIQASNTEHIFLELFAQCIIAGDQYYKELKEEEIREAEGRTFGDLEEEEEMRIKAIRPAWIGQEL